MDDDTCVDFLQWALPRLEMRWEGFRKPRGQVCKRIRRRMDGLGLEGVEAYREHLERHSSEWDVLDGFCRVTISRFFRDRGVWRHLERVALPDLLERLGRGATMQAWSAGCASGEEPYSLRIVWELAELPVPSGTELRVVATDTGPEMLERCRRACYPEGNLKEVPDGWKERAFEAPDDEGERCLRPRFRQGVELRLSDVRSEAPEAPLHLVLCRNLVFTYHSPGIQREVLRRVLDRMPEGARLVLGAHEELPGGDWPLEPDDTAEPVWRTRAG